MTQQGGTTSKRPAGRDNRRPGAVFAVAACARPAPGPARSGELRAPAGRKAGAGARPGARIVCLRLVMLPRTALPARRTAQGRPGCGRRRSSSPSGGCVSTGHRGGRACRRVSRPRRTRSRPGCATCLPCPIVPDHRYPDIHTVIRFCRGWRRPTRPGVTRGSHQGTQPAPDPGLRAAAAPREPAYESREPASPPGSSGRPSGAPQRRASRDSISLRHAPQSTPPSPAGACPHREQVRGPASAIACLHPGTLSQDPPSPPRDQIPGL